MKTNYHKGYRSVYQLTAHVVLVTKYRKKAINQQILNKFLLLVGFHRPLTLVGLTGVLIRHLR